MLSREDNELLTRVEVPGPPELEWTHVPASHRYVSKRIQACN
jgi:hypothetical protein